MLIALMLATAPPVAPPSSSPQAAPPALQPWTTRAHYIPSSLVHVMVHDPAARRYLTFTLYDYPDSLGHRVVRTSGRYEDVPRQPSYQLTFAQCPGLRANFEALVRLPLPSLFLEGVSARPALATPNQLIYRIEGRGRLPGGQRGMLHFEERGSDSVRPGAFARWSETLVRDFEQCVQRVIAAEGASR
jgi:hypothetical protein